MIPFIHECFIVPGMEVRTLCMLDERHPLSLVLVLHHLWPTVKLAPRIVNERTGMSFTDCRTEESMALCLVWAAG